MAARTVPLTELSRKLQGRHKLGFFPSSGERENELFLNFGKSICSSSLKDDLSATS